MLHGCELNPKSAMWTLPRDSEPAKMQVMIDWVEKRLVPNHLEATYLAVENVHGTRRSELESRRF